MSDAEVDTDPADSSDSDDDTPVVRKSHTVRNRAAVLLETVPSQELSKTCTSNIYSQKITSGWDALLAGKLVHQLRKAGSDVEEDEPLAKKSKGKNPKRGAASNSAKATPSITLSDSDGDELLENGQKSTSRDPEQRPERSPSPPPPPRSPTASATTPTRRGRRPRNTRKRAKLNQAIDDLVDLQGQVHRERTLNDSTSSDVVIVDDNTPTTPSTPDKSITIKVRSRSGIQRFTVRRGDSFQSVMQQMAAHEFVPVDRIVMYMNDHTIQPYDTPGSLSLHIADIIECHIQKESQRIVEEHDIEDDVLLEPNMIRLMVQGSGAATKMVIPVSKTETLEKLMRQYAAKRNVSYQKLTFHFDGEEFSRKDTPEKLDMEDNDVIDVTGL